ncbi:hypothetical protein [Rhodococcus sp. T7]|uniref:hypothetical protein n=1 Tax=Rhodococcus sp. T7 TaxID=627444 RepID=UPI00135869F2|nr:hypothetical protein [Rhodococcus sp. T7]KAF0957343.1 hypothetical protein MLGJGCBP_09174 [Rhodococcus sp. T7]KAF0966737.1 hypothetical protein MLGJGCBP_00111 [Rhodococcus sp. T7]
MYSSVRQPVRITRALRILVAILTSMAIPVILAQQARADHTFFPLAPVPPMSESFRDGPVAISPASDVEIIHHPIGGIGGHAVFAKTVLTNPTRDPHGVSCALRTTSGNFDTATVTIPPRWADSRGVEQNGSVTVSLQAIDRPTASIAHFGSLTCRSGGVPVGLTASMSKVWAISVQN